MAKEKKVRNRWIGARFDEDEATEVDAYIAAYEEANDGKELSVTDIVRRGLREFMHNHPIKAPIDTTQTQPTKPGE